MKIKEYLEKLEIEKKARLKMTDEEISREIFGDVMTINPNHEKAEIYNKELKTIFDLARKDVFNAIECSRNTTLSRDLINSVAKSWSEDCKGKKSQWTAKIVWE